MLKATDISNRSNVAYTEWARSLQHAKTLAIPELRPAPCPPVEARPIQLSATSIESWIKNPYHIYVTKILHLHPLDLLDQDSTASERGSFVHHILEKFLRSLGDGPLPPTAYQQLLDLGKAESITQPVDSAQWLIWWPRFERLAAWFVANENSWRARATPWLLEESGKYTFATARGKFTLTAKADRIDRLRSGGAAIIDYKTGEPPTQKDVQSGKSCQLPLEGLILRHGGYAQAEEAKILAYWKISGGNEPGKSKEHILSSIAEENLITNAEQGLKNLVAAYDQFDTPYIAHPPSGARIYDEEKAIAHLARVAEWGNIESEESGGEE